MNNYVPLQVRFGQHPFSGRIDGWRVLAICILLNRTSRGQVEKVLPRFFFSFPVALHGEIATYHLQSRLVMERLLAPLGFQLTRTQRIALMSKEWLDHEDWHRADRVGRFSGCGQYAEDAYRIFVEGDCTKPAGDHVLEAWRKVQGLEHSRSAI